MEASALQVPVRIPRGRTAIGASLLRLRSDDQLVALFRAGDEDAFCVIHDRYRQRLFAYTRQMLPGSAQDAEDALQDVFVRAYSGLRASDRDLALRPWLYRVAHNRCIDVLRRPPAPAPELLELTRGPAVDPMDEAERRDSLRILIRDVRRLPEQQRSALLMRELSGMSYTDLATALGVSIPAVKSLLVRARVSLAQSIEARDTACSQIREELTLAHDRGVRPNATSRRHLQDCAPCRDFRHELRGHSRQFAALVPALGPAGVLANIFGFGGGSGGAAATGILGGGSAAAAGGVLATGAGHIVTLLAAAAVAAGGAVEIQHTIVAPATPTQPSTSQSTATASSGASPTNALAAVATQGAEVAMKSAAAAALASSTANLPPAPATPDPSAAGPGPSATAHVSSAPIPTFSTSVPLPAPPPDPTAAPAAASTSTSAGTTSSGTSSTTPTSTGSVAPSTGTGTGTTGSGSSTSGTGSGSTTTGTGSSTSGTSGSTPPSTTTGPTGTDPTGTGTAPTPSDATGTGTGTSTTTTGSTPS